jgi:predicted Zn finger-like uncharacterized protein
MITQCSHCGTKFEISTELVESDDPRVRCGECLEVFNAKAQLVPEATFVEPAIPTVTQKVATGAGQRTGAGQPVPAVELDGYISADDLENAVTLSLNEPVESTAAGNHASQPRVNDGFYSPDLQVEPRSANREQSSQTTADDEFERTLVLDLGDSDDAPDGTGQTELPAVDLQGGDAHSDAVYASEAPPIDDFQLASEREQSRDTDAHMYDNDSAVELRRHVSQRGGEVLPIATEEQSHRTQQHSMLMPLLCVALALAATLYFARERVAQLDLPEPVLSAFCGLAGCELPVKQDLTRLELLQHRMNIHSERTDVLVINVDMINNAPYRQPYPVLAVGMFDQDEAIVAERKFQPEDYLEPELLDATLPAGEPVRIRFEILDPGPEAVTSEVVFE